MAAKTADTAPSEATETTAPSEAASGISDPADAAIFDRFFGGDGDVEDSDDSPKAKPKPKGKPPAKPDGKPKALGEKPPAKATDGAPSEENTSTTEADASSVEEQDSTEEPSPKAKELFAKAKAAKDTKEARKLYKQAMKAAFGEVPDEFNDARFASARDSDRKRSEAIEARDTAAATREANLERNANDWVAKLTPAMAVHKRLQTIRDEGNFPALGEWIAEVLGKPVDEAMRLFTRGVKEGPEARSAREAIAASKASEQAAMARIAKLEESLAAKEASKEEQARQERIAAKRGAYTEELTTQLADHPVSSLPGGIKRVLAFLIKTADVKLKAPTKTPEQAADFIVASERRRLKAARHLLDEDDDTPTPKPRTSVPPVVPRGQTRDSGKAPNESSDAAFERLWSKHSPAKRRR